MFSLAPKAFDETDTRDVSCVIEVQNAALRRPGDPRTPRNMSNSALRQRKMLKSKLTKPSAERIYNIKLFLMAKIK